MKISKLWFFAIALAMGFLSAMTSCGSSCSKDEDDSTALDTVAPMAQDTTYELAIERYLVETIAPNYAQAEISIPNVAIIGVDESNTEDIQVWGDFWVFNYNVSGDTLKTVSGGNHPGLIHLRKIGKEYEVTSIDEVADGAGNLESAKKIFGDKFEKFQATNSDESLREQSRQEDIKEYVQKSGLKVSMYQDYGWPPVKLY